MKNRIVMNSRSLQAKFPGVYREFFSQCPIVVSAPGSFFWAGEFSIMEGGLGILQKLPIRVYIGLKPNHSQDASFGEVKTLDPSKAKFQNYIFEEPFRSKLLNFIKKNLNGYEISAISEIPPGCGMNMSGAFAAALACAILMCKKKINTQNFNQNIDRIFRLSWKIESISHGDVSSGSTAFVPLVGSSYPIVYFSEKRGGDFDKLSPGARFPKNIQNHYEIIDKIYYQGFSLDRLFKFNKQPSWPIDFGLIYSGDVRTTASTNVAIEEVRDILKEVSPYIEKTFPEFLDPEKENIPFFYRICSQKGWRGLWQIYSDVLIVSCLEVLCAFEKIFREGLSADGLKSFFRAINTHHDQLRAINLSSDALEYIRETLKKEVKKLGDEYGVATKLLGSGEKGDILFVLAYHGLRDQMNRVIDKMRKETGEDIWLDYASWIDGIESEAVKVEQCLVDGIYSKFISEGSISIERWEKSGKVQSEILSLEDFEKEKSKVDLLLDLTQKDVYIKGRKLGSKEIPSSSATVKVLRILLQNIGKSVANTKLPKSSYSSDRNELQSKIISPLKKIVKKYIKKDLPLSISGGLYEFKVRLDQSDLDIRVLDKIF